jgi:hypothetical protein
MSSLQTLSWDPDWIPDSPMCELIPSLSKPSTPSMCLLTGIGSKLLSAATVHRQDGFQRGLQWAGRHDGLERAVVKRRRFSVARAAG